MKKFMSKKVLLSITAGILATAIAIGGTFAWFTSTKETNTNTVVTAQVKLAACSNVEAFVLNFLPNDPVNIPQQIALEAGFINTTQPEKNAHLAAWWNATRTTPGYAISDTGLTYQPGEVDMIKFLKDPSKVANGVISGVTPGSFIYSDATFANESNVPTYFRVKMAELTGLTNPNIMLQAGYITWDHSTLPGALLVDGGDGYFYCPTPIPPDQTNIKVMLTAYILGEANGNELQNSSFSFGAKGGELIQATNNAVHLIGTWSNTVAYESYAQ